MLFDELSLEGLVAVMVVVGIILLFIKNLRMPKQYYDNREVFDTKLKEKILTTPNYFGVIKAMPEDFDLDSDGVEEVEAQPAE